ncbi:AAA family ATPase [Anaerostipes sp.]|uniref:AAA family ATPase n=1 Tax=Anaerostipes sp. TaxID=1872530 RepID=UPI003967627A
MLETIFEECSQERFVFVLDEWDFIFHKDFITEENKKQYIQFLSNLLKDRPYVQMTYMTGILPIAKYSDGSELNMFDEYDMACKEKYSEYFGFLDEKVNQLYNIYKKITKNPKILRIELKEWYDGYRAAAGDYLYNPRSVVCALRDNQLANYWTSSGTYDSIFNYIKGNIADVRNDILGIILELKINHTPQEAIEQIKEKNYQLRFQGKIGEISAYEGSILVVGISYDRKTKKHSCEVEKL